VIAQNHRDFVAEILLQPDLFIRIQRLRGPRGWRYES
jgi:hypothetical protein